MLVFKKGLSMRTSLLILLGAVTIFTGCSEKSGVFPAGDGTYMITNQAATGFSGLQGIKTDAYKRADTFCKRQTKVFHILNVTQTEPPYILGNYPRIELQFTCK